MSRQVTASPVSAGVVATDAVGLSAAALSGAAPIKVWMQLLKPRVMTLVVLSGFAGMLVAPGDLHPVLGFVAVLCIAIGAGAAGAINMWYDRDIDAVMARTRRRPLVMGQLPASEALAFGIVLSLFSVMLMGLALNWVAAALLAFAIFFYVFVYTIWLKRRTPQNIVIGGAAGALPPMIGWAAATGEITLGSVVLFALIFFWTPPHFWALALYRSNDYERAGVPMLPVVAGRKATERQILYYTLALLPLALLPTFLGLAGWLYGGVALILGLFYIASALAILRDKTDKSARQSFGFSILYLFVLFTLLIIDRQPFILGGPGAVLP
ncbi:MAG: heme o synthase [Rhodospirillales bacterium]